MNKAIKMNLTYTMKIAATFMAVIMLFISFAMYNYSITGNMVFWGAAEISFLSMFFLPIIITFMLYHNKLNLFLNMGMTRKNFKISSYISYLCISVFIALLFPINNMLLSLIQEAPINPMIRQEYAEFLTAYPVYAGFMWILSVFVGIIFIFMVSDLVFTLINTYKPNIIVKLIGIIVCMFFSYIIYPIFFMVMYIHLFRGIIILQAVVLIISLTLGFNSYKILTKPDA